jgi:hypothetical protein
LSGWLLPYLSDPTKVRNMPSVRQILELLGWDGVLPALVAAGPALAKAFFPRGHIAEIVAAILVPIFAALVRAGVGRQQITHACDGRAPLIRQLTLAAAIVLLLLFEATSGVLTCADDEPAHMWLFPAVFYAGYLALILHALRRQSEKLLHASTGNL